MPGINLLAINHPVFAKADIVLQDSLSGLFGHILMPIYVIIITIFVDIFIKLSLHIVIQAKILQK